MAYPKVQIELFLADHSLDLVKQGFDTGIYLGVLNDMAYHAVLAGIGPPPPPNHLVMPQSGRDRILQALPCHDTKDHPVQLIQQINRHITAKTAGVRNFLLGYFDC